MKAYYSSDKRFRFTVTPRDITNPLEFFEGKLRDDKQPGQRQGSAQTFARGVLERVGAREHWTVMWDRHLVNEVAPVRALISDSGLYVVTFDNWHFLGLGDNVVVIYGPQGKLVRSLALNDILPDFYIKALPRSVSSIHWGGNHHILEPSNTLILKIVVPSDNRNDNPRYVERGVDLSTGQVQPSTDGSWRLAVAEAMRVAKEQQAAEAAADDAFKAPLLGPTTTDDTAWHRYLVEAFFFGWIRIGRTAIQPPRCYEHPTRSITRHRRVGSAMNSWPKRHRKSTW